MEYAIKVEDGRPPVIRELVPCIECANSVVNENNGNLYCHLRSATWPQVGGDDFCSWAVRVWK